MGRVACIDIGTVTCRLAAADVSDGRVKRLHKRSTIVDPGDNLTQTGMICDAARQRVLACVDAYLAEDEVRRFLQEVGFEGVTLTRGDGDFTSLMARLMYTPTTLFLDSGGNPAALPLIGSPEDVEETYLEAVNGALEALGKPAIALIKADA